ncbi:Phage integrase, N-terminal SAM-like domain [Desulfonispora thiosulfatigenes DSM 11270]|uniref:Phage integrase, N-terminal SAM-like domain n=1 Tax=Desulfonispora thiosulfatigenes DSM 11270 TaxID=656914 RepID=A0A1W1UNR5_DESTI|nr:tyrosine-type recombinase/integrase [Desulfonispora thiosulfatigenes]SMB82663.1 Phage integrase, N-terminal SAM-like domain [Desulfonispora thiosulfatigenes DSM 11270]
MLFMQAVKLFGRYQANIERSPVTIRAYYEDLTLLNRYLQEKYNCLIYLEDITQEDIENYLYYLKEIKHYQPISRKRVLGSMRSFFSYAYKSQWCSQNVTARLEPIKCQQKERHYLSEEEVNLFVAAIKHDLVRLVAQTLYYTGMRISECLNLKVEDVNLEDNLIHIRHGKGNKDRFVPINSKLKKLLVDYNENWKVVSEYFFATRISGTLSPTRVAKVFRETTGALGWKKKVTAHILRHSFASKLVKNDVHLVKISKLLGHSSLKTTSIYVHSHMDDLKDAVNTL